MRFLILILTALFLSTPCRGASEELWDSLGVDRLPQAAQEYGVEAELSPDLTLDGALEQAAGLVGRYLPGVIKAGVRSALTLMAVVLLCAMADSAQTGEVTGGLRPAVMAGALSITALSVSDMTAMMGLGRRTIDNMQGFAQALLPAVAAVNAAAGSPGGAAVRQIATALFSNLLLSLIDRLLLPLLYAYVCACTACAAVGNPGLKKVSQVLKWVISGSLTALLLLFVTYLTVSGVLSGTTDAAAVKAAKLAISTAVPVVGKIISDAAETILVGAGVLRNTVGLFGMVVVVCLCIAPFLQLGMHYLAYKLTGALAAILADPRLGELIDGISTAFALLLGMTGSCALMLLISIVSGLGGAA